MVKDIVKDMFFLHQPSAPAARKDKKVADNLLDTLKANSITCVGLAANMIASLSCRWESTMRQCSILRL